MRRSATSASTFSPWSVPWPAACRTALLPLPRQRHAPYLPTAAWPVWWQRLAPRCGRSSTLLLEPPLQLLKLLSVSLLAAFFLFFLFDTCRCWAFADARGCDCAAIVVAVGGQPVAVGATGLTRLSQLYNAHNYVSLQSCCKFSIPFAARAFSHFK